MAAYARAIASSIFEVGASSRLLWLLIQWWNRYAVTIALGVFLLFIAPYVSSLIPDPGELRVGAQYDIASGSLVDTKNSSDPKGRPPRIQPVVLAGLLGGFDEFLDNVTADQFTPTVFKSHVGDSGFLPEPFTCVAPDPATCIEPPNSQNPTGFTQERCIPVNPDCAGGTCFGICADENGDPLTNVDALDAILYNEEGNLVSTNPIGDIIAANAEGVYCAYEVSDRCGDPAQGGGCAFVLECEQKRVCENEQCVLKPGRSLVGGEVGCETDAECSPTRNACVNQQCVQVAEPGEDECGSSADCAEPRPYRRACLTSDILAREFDLAGNPLLLNPDIPLRGEPLNPGFGQCTLVACTDAEIASGNCTDANCTLGSQCGVTEITPVPLRLGCTLDASGAPLCTEIPCPPGTDPNGECDDSCATSSECVATEAVCGDGICSPDEDTSCPADCVLRRDEPLSPPPSDPGGIGGGLPPATCSDTDGVGTDVDGNGIIEPWEFYDSCLIDGESTILCGDALDCTRPFRSTCQGDSCIIATGPGANMCGEPASATDTAALDDAICSLDCPGFPPAGSSCGVGTGDCAPEFLVQIFGPEEACNASVICQAESGGVSSAKNASCIDSAPNNPDPVEFSIGLFQINLTAGVDINTGIGGRCAAGTFSWNGRRCSIANQITFDTCLADYGFNNPLVNAQRAYEIWSGQGWSPWSTAWTCGIVG